MSFMHMLPIIHNWIELFYASSTDTLREKVQNISAFPYMYTPNLALYHPV